jgi:dephospho-CoA kinase
MIDADHLAREIVAPGSEVLQIITDSFGEGVLNADGTLHRAALAEIVFNDPDSLTELNQISHPAILARTQEHIVDLTNAGFRWIVYEAALIVGSQMAPALDALVVVYASEPVRVERVVRRDRLNTREVLARIASQVRPQVLLDAADYVVSNEGSLEELEIDARRVLSLLTDRLGPPRAEGN